MNIELPSILFSEDVQRSLREDLGRAGDLSTLATIGVDQMADAAFVAREGGVVCGLVHAQKAFELIDPALKFEILMPDGSIVSPGDAVARVTGRARPILFAERTALNFACHLSGIATMTARYVSEIAHTHARMCCTRKTIPGMRTSQKYAVRCGGGWNHRFGLDDAILIKDNHIAVAGGIEAALRGANAFAGHLVKIEIEVDTLSQLDEALTHGADCILLDNFETASLIEAVQLTAGRAKLEASGGVRLSSVREIAETGVDYISSSQLTMSAETFDIGLDIAVS
jgi:nicotinate-nucleotide pyrophosphorylase (carboxylating)